MRLSKHEAVLSDQKTHVCYGTHAMKQVHEEQLKSQTNKTCKQRGRQGTSSLLQNNITWTFLTSLWSKKPQEAYLQFRTSWRSHAEHSARTAVQTTGSLAHKAGQPQRLLDCHKHMELQQKHVISSWVWLTFPPWLSPPVTAGVPFGSASCVDTPPVVTSSSPSQRSPILRLKHPHHTHSFNFLARSWMDSRIGEFYIFYDGEPPNCFISLP